MEAPPLELKPISIAIVDSHSIVRGGLTAFFASNPNRKVVGQCGDGLAALEMIQSLNPDFVVLEIYIPKLGGLELIRTVRQMGHACKLIVLSLNRDERVVAEALRAGADGYVLKDGPSRHLLDAIQYIENGGVYVSPELPAHVSSQSGR